MCVCVCMHACIGPMHVWVYALVHVCVCVCVWVCLAGTGVTGVLLPPGTSTLLDQGYFLWTIGHPLLTHLVPGCFSREVTCYASTACLVTRWSGFA